MSKILKVLAVDFDGTLVESNEIKDSAFNEIFDEWPEHKKDIMEWHVTNNTIDRRQKFIYFAERYLGKSGQTDIVESLTERFSKLTKQAIIECPFVEGAELFLKNVSDRLPIYLLSATPQLELEEILVARNIGKYFRKIYGAPINKTSVLKEVCEKEVVTPSQIVFIGDTMDDFEAAQGLGIAFIGRKSTRELPKRKCPSFRDFNAIGEYLNDQYLG